MGRVLIKSLVALAAISLAGTPSLAGERKSAGRTPQSRQALAVRDGMVTFSPTGKQRHASSARTSAAEILTRPLRPAKKDEDAGPSRRARTPLTLMELDSAFGKVAVQPVFGSVNGAQFSVGF